MTEIEISPIPTNTVEVVNQAASSLGLIETMFGTLLKYPESTHWHFGRAKCSGTLEVTWFPSGNRLWISYHENRTGDGWVEVVAMQLAYAIGNNKICS